MFRAALIALALTGTALPAFANDPLGHGGMYHGEGEGQLTVDLVHIEDDRYSISINTIVPMENGFGGCAGGVDGEILLDKSGGNFFAENELYDPEGTLPVDLARYCEIGLTFDGEGNLVMEEREGCMAYHGAACGFSGELSHEGVGL